MLNKTGGHTGHGLKHCAIRRWVANQDCTVTISGQIRHATDNGDGVSGHVLFRDRSLVTGHVLNSSKELAVDTVTLKAGEPVDFVAYCGTNESHDSFHWTISIEQHNPSGTSIRHWNSEKDFSPTPPSQRLSPEAQLAQTLLLTNEFTFID